MNQTYSNLEIILVDDGSTESCPEICDIFAKEDGRVHVIHGQNSGTGAARNIGLDIAKGNWICFVDSDDFVSKRFVEILLNAVKDGNCLTAQCKYKTGSESSIFEEETAPKITYLDWKDYFFYCAFTNRHSVLGLCTNICHSSLFSDIRFPPIRRAEDNFAASQVLWASRHNLLAVVDCQLYYYYKHGESKTRKKADLSSLGLIEAFEMNLSYWEEREEQDILKWYQNQYFSSLIHTYLIICRDNVCIDEQRYLKQKIKDELSNAMKICHEKIMLPLGISEIAHHLIRKKSFIMYGLGFAGTYFLPWLRNFDFNILEIWDRSASNEYYVDGIKVCNAHKHIDKNITILITVGDEKVAFSITRNLRRFGYSNFVYQNTLNNIIKYLQYKTYIPFLVESHESRVKDVIPPKALPLKLWLSDIFHNYWNLFGEFEMKMRGGSRDGAGRKKKPDHPRRIPVTIRLPK